MLKIIQNIKQFIKRMFSFKFVHPIIDEQIDHAINDKLKKRRLEQEDETVKYNDKLNSYLRTYFSKDYATPQEMAMAFALVNKQWQELCRSVNSKNKLINLNKNSFKDRVKLTLIEINKKK